LLYERGEKEPDRNRGGIATERVEAVVAASGQLTTQEVLHCRVRYFADGMILGSRLFVLSSETGHPILQDHLCKSTTYNIVSLLLGSQASRAIFTPAAASP